MKFYVITAPAEIKGIYKDWPSCQRAVHGVSGAKYKSVKTREEAEHLLSGKEMKLERGQYVFIDGNHRGGIGCVFVAVDGDGKEKAKELGTNVFEVFSGIWSEFEIETELRNIRNILSELGGLHVALSKLKKGSRAVIVHDYTGVAEWMEKRWKIRDKAVHRIVEACTKLRNDRELQISFKHQPAHQAASGPRNPFIEYNRRADELATKASVGHTSSR